MSATPKVIGAALLAAVLTALLLLTPVGLASAQDATTQDDTTQDDTTQDDATHGDTTRDEEREARRAERDARRQAWLEAFAAELGVTADEVTAAARAVLEDELAQRVADGDLTQAQADAILARVDERGGLGLLGGLGHGPGGPWRGFGPGHHDD